MKKYIVLFMLCFVFVKPALAACKFACGDGTGSAISTSSTSAIAPENTNCTYDGHIFIGWLYGSTIYQPGDSLGNMTTCLLGTRNYTAQWEEESSSSENPLDLVTVASKSYVDAEYSGKQDKLSGTNGYLVTYGAGAGETVGKQIVTSLGTSTTATTVPTTGAVYTGVNNKQATVSGTSGYAMLGTATAGTVGQKAIYGNGAQYMDALIENGTLNTAVTNAANNELTCYDNDCTLWQINTSATRIAGVYDSSIDQTSYCFRRLDGATGSDGSCSASTLSYLGTDDANNKSGKWGKVYPYGNVSGISVCSSTSGTANTVATAAQATTLSAEYTAQAGDGTLDSGQTYCWCKMGNPYSGKWVSRGSFSNCANTCSYQCGMYSSVAYRTALLTAE